MLHPAIPVTHLRCHIQTHSAPYMGLSVGSLCCEADGPLCGFTLVFWVCFASYFVCVHSESLFIAPESPLLCCDTALHFLVLQKTFYKRCYKKVFDAKRLSHLLSDQSVAVPCISMSFVCLLLFMFLHKTSLNMAGSVLFTCIVPSLQILSCFFLCCLFKSWTEESKLLSLTARFHPTT